jgi:hypothetical protein
MRLLPISDRERELILNAIDAEIAALEAEMAAPGPSKAGGMTLPSCAICDGKSSEA